MKKLRAKLTPDYDSQTLKQTIGKMLADRVIPKLKDKKRTKAKTAEETGEIDVTSDVASWFLGPRGENVDLFSELVSVALNDHVFWRRNFHPSDPSPITESMKRDEAYLDAVDLIKTEFYALLAQLKKSGPFASMRYQGHMTWDQTLPGMAGYFAAMLYNQNNVALEASPITTVLEVEACEDLCHMLGYQATDPQPWGHLTCGGSTANIEALWAARNLKFYPFSFREGLTEAAPEVADRFMVNLPSGTQKLLKNLSEWEMLNLSVDEVLDLFNRAVTQGVDEVALNAAIDPWSLQNMGFMDFSAKFLTDPDVGDGVVLVPASKHYSLPKGAALLGLGAKNMHTLPLDVYGRMDAKELKSAIDDYIQGNNTDDGKKHPIIAVVAVFGTTEEGNVDPLVDILAAQETYRSQNVDFAVHADCAWGGYFASLLRDDGSGGVPIAVSEYVMDQYGALGSTDTITIDPHKTGYLPYPAGALCYRNMAMRSLIAFEAPYINTGDGDGTPPEWLLGTYGIEGSKPGAAAAGVYLSHAAIPLTLQGYGKLMTLTAYNCKIFHWKLLEASDRETDFMVEPTPHMDLPGGSQTKEEAVKSFLSKLSGKTPQSILKDTTGADLEVLRGEGADLNILTYAFNYKVNGVLVGDLDKVNAFNERIYDRISLKADGRDIYNYKILVSTTSFFKDTYGEVFFNDYRDRLLGTTVSPASSSGSGEKIVVMRSTIMDPWITEDVDGTPFVDYIVAELFDIVREVVAEVLAEEGVAAG